MLSLKDVCLQEVFRIYSHGSISYGDFLVLLQFCQGKECVVELGTCTGSTTALLSIMAKEVKSFDVFESLELIDNEEQRKFYENNWKQTKHTFESVCGYLSNRKNIFVLKSLSHLAAGLYEDSFVDVLFIDAEHSYTGVKHDYQSWFDKVKLGGIFLFHDVVNAKNLEGVFNFYKNELLNDNRIVELPTVNGCCLSSIKAFRRIK